MSEQLSSYKNVIIASKILNACNVPWVEFIACKDLLLYNNNRYEIPF